MFGGQDWNRLNYDPTIEGGLTAAQIITGALGGAILSQFISPPRSGRTRGGTKYQARDIPSAPKKRRISTGPSHSSIIPGGSSGPEPPSTMSKPNSSHTPTDGDDINVVPIPKRISKIAPDYFTIELPFFECRLHTRAAASPLTSYFYRLNSIYDASEGGSAHQPRGRDKFAAFGYKYYRVLKTEVNMTFVQARVAGDSPTQHTIVGYELNDDPADLYTDTVAMVEGKQSTTDMLLSTNSVFNGAHGHVVKMHYTYVPEQWDHHVHTESTEERWTPMDDNPPYQARIFLKTGAMFDSAGSETNHATNVRTMVFIKYTVQFREQTFAKGSADTSVVTVPPVT